LHAVAVTAIDPRPPRGQRSSPRPAATAAAAQDAGDVGANLSLLLADRCAPRRAAPNLLRCLQTATRARLKETTSSSSDAMSHRPQRRYVHF